MQAANRLVGELKGKVGKMSGTILILLPRFICNTNIHSLTRMCMYVCVRPV